MSSAHEDQPLVVPVRDDEGELGPWMLLVSLAVLLMLVGFFFLPTGQEASAAEPAGSGSPATEAPRAHPSKG